MAYEEEQGYDPEASVADTPQAQEQGVDAGDSAAADMPLPDDAASKPAVRNWVRQLLDYTRSAFGINEEAVPTGSPAGQPYQAGEYDESTPNPASGSPAGPPQQVGGYDESTPDAASGSPAGLPQGEEGLDEPATGSPAGALPDEGEARAAGANTGASFDRPTGTAGGVRERPRPPTQLDAAGSAPFQRDPGAALESQTGVLGAAGKRMFGAQEPPTSDTMQKLKDYVMGTGAEPAAQTEQRIAQVATETPGATESQVADEALKRAAAQSPEAGAAALQGYRQLQTSFRGKAAAALDHNDADTATKLWNKAHTYVPDGTHATAIQTPTGITMVMTRPDGVQVTTQLTQDQFRELLHKRAGEFDHLTESGIEANVKQLARSPGMPPPGQDQTMTKGVGTINGGEGDRNLSTTTGQGAPFGSRMSPRQRSQMGFGDVQPSDSQGRSKEAQAAQGLRPQTADMARPPPGRPAAGDMSPEARATRMTQWASQNRPGQRERLTEALRQGDTKETTARVAAENKVDLAQRGQELRAQENQRREVQGNRSRDQADTRIQDRREHYSQQDAAKVADRIQRMDANQLTNQIRTIDAKMNREGYDALTSEEKAFRDLSRQRATEGIQRQPAAPAPTSARGAPQGVWQTNTKTGKQRWVPEQQ